MQKSFNKKDFVLAMFILLFTVGLTGCGKQCRWADGTSVRCNDRENVVVKNDNEKVIYNGYQKPTYLYLRDLKDNTIRRVEYVSELYSFAEPGDTLTLKIPHKFFVKYYKAKKYKHGKANMVELRRTTVQDWVWLKEVLVGQTYIEDTYGMIGNHQAIYYVQKEQEDRAKKAELDNSIKRKSYAPKAQIQNVEKFILSSDDDFLKQALSITKAKEREDFIMNSAKLAMEKQKQELEKQRSTYQAKERVDFIMNSAKLAMEENKPDPSKESNLKDAWLNVLTLGMHGKVKYGKLGGYKHRMDEEHYEKRAETKAYRKKWRDFNKRMR